MQTQTPAARPSRAIYGLLIVCVVITLLVWSAVLLAWLENKGLLHLPSLIAFPSSQSTPIAPTAAVARSAPAAPALAAATQPPTPQPVIAQPDSATTGIGYVSADGDGVFIRSKPDMEAKVRVWPDGTAMDLLEESNDWSKVRAPDGYVGYIPTRWLVRPLPAPSATRQAKAPAAAVAPSQRDSRALTQTEQQYFTWALAIGSAIINSSERLTPLLAKADLASAAWKESVRKELAVWLAADKEARERTAPPLFAGVHEQFKATLSHYARAATLVDDGIRGLDGSKFLQASSELEIAMDTLALAAEEADRLAASPMQP